MKNKQNPTRRRKLSYFKAQSRTKSLSAFNDEWDYVAFSLQKKKWQFVFLRIKCYLYTYKVLPLHALKVPSKDVQDVIIKLQLPLNYLLCFFCRSDIIFCDLCCITYSSSEHQLIWTFSHFLQQQLNKEATYWQSTYQICENSSSPSRECSGLLNTDFSMVREPPAWEHTVGWRGVPFLNLNGVLMKPIGFILLFTLAF